MQFSLTNSPKRVRDKLAAAAAAFALLGAAGTLSSSAASASASQTRQNSAALQAALGGDLNRYLSARRTAEHISGGIAASHLRRLQATHQPGHRDHPLRRRAAGTGRGAVADRQQHQGLHAVILLQLEAQGKLSMSDPIGRWLPQYPAWRHITIRQLLDMTSRIPDYLYQPAFAMAFAADQHTNFTAARLVSYVAGLPLGPAGYHYTNTDYILAQMIIEKVTHDSYADQLTKRIITPLGLRTTCLAPYTCPASDAGRVPAGYFYIAGGAVADGQAHATPSPDLGPGRRRDRQLIGRYDHLGPRPLPGTPLARPPAATARVPGVHGHGPADPPHHRR